MATAKRRTKSAPAPGRPRPAGRPPAPNPPAPSRRSLVKKRVGWPLCGLGAVLFVASYVASQAGVQILPFDHHHIIGQFGGGAMTLTGLIWATTRLE